MTLTAFVRKVSTYFKRGKHGQRWAYHKMGLPRQLYHREYFLTPYGDGFVAMPTLDALKAFAFAGFWHRGELFLPSALEPPDWAVAVGRSGPYTIYRVDKFTLWRSRKGADTILRELRRLADGIPSRVVKLVRDVKAKQGKVRLVQREGRLYVELTDEEIREEIERILKGLWISKRKGWVRRNPYQVRLRLIQHNYLPVDVRHVESGEELPSFELKYPELYPHQRKTADLFMRTGAMTVTWPHGSGKTALALEVIRRLRKPTLIVVPSISLLGEWRERFEKYTTLTERRRWWEPNPVGILGGGKEDVRPITVTTYQSAPKVAHRYWPLIVVDEAHHLPADTFRQIAAIPHDYILGLTGSPYREDGRTADMYSLAGSPDPFGSVWADFYEKYVWRPTIYVVSVGWPSRVYEERYAQADETEKYVVASKNPAKLRHLDYYVRRYRKVIVFAEWVDLAKRIARRLGCPVLYGDTPLRQRQAICEWMRRQDRAVVVMTRAGEEGIDLPSVEACVDVAWQYGSRRQALQRAGRLMRLAEGKKFADYVYLVTRGTVEEDFLKKRLAVAEEHGMPIVYVT